jgi:NADP-dependent 3-hydroxy acid dehydrogenase YdfG
MVSTAGLKIVPTMGVYAATKNAVRTATEALRQEAGPNLRVTEISPGMTATNSGDSITDLAMKKKIEDDLGAIAMPAEAIARGILFAIEQPPGVDVAASSSAQQRRDDGASTPQEVAGPLQAKRGPALPSEGPR